MKGTIASFVIDYVTGTIDDRSPRERKAEDGKHRAEQELVTLEAEKRLIELRIARVEDIRNRYDEIRMREADKRHDAFIERYNQEVPA